jgi:hypothetical protein
MPISKIADWLGFQLRDLCIQWAMLRQSDEVFREQQQQLECGIQLASKAVLHSPNRNSRIRDQYIQTAPDQGASTLAQFPSMPCAELFSRLAGVTITSANAQIIQLRISHPWLRV